jgi:hypothetical protein
MIKKVMISLFLLVTSCSMPNEKKYRYHMISHVLGEKWEVEKCPYCRIEKSMELRAHTVITLLHNP